MSKTSEVAIRVEDVAKTFSIHHGKTSIKTGFVNLFKQKKSSSSMEDFRVLKGVSFEVNKGDFFGIVGRNGSGKSTLLKIISEIYQPTSGKVTVNGSLVPFIELGVGFNPELTGRENVYLNGALLGFSRQEMEEKYDDIVKFAELEKFMDEKLKNYSSGMQVRLAFSVAIRADADILILDEVLAVGDEAFQRKCFQYFAHLRRQKKTVILVTHSMDSVQQFCTKAMLIDKGHKTEIGTPTEIAQIYRGLNKAEKVEVRKEEKRTVNKYIKAEVDLTRSDGKVLVDISITPEQVLEDPMMSFAIYKDTGEQVYRWVSDEGNRSDTDLSRAFTVHIEIEDVLPYGDYYASVFMKNRMRTVDYADFIKIAKFTKESPKEASTNDKFWKLNEISEIKNVE